MGLFWILPTEVPDSSPAAELREAWSGLSTDELVSQAVAHRDAGDHQGASQRLALADERSDRRDETAYQLGILRELDLDFDGALARYDEVLALGPDTSRALDAAFRRALCLEDLGRHDESLAQVDALKALGHWSDTDRQSLDLARGIAELHAQKSRHGEKLVTRTLDDLEGTHEITWMRARAETALLESILTKAGGTSLEFNHRLKHHLHDRAVALVVAEKHVVRIAKLDEPEYVLTALVDLGDGYRALDQDLHEQLERADGQLPPILVAYAPFSGPRGSVLLDKAFDTYEQGSELADRLAWKGPVRNALHDRRDALALPPPES